jgi:hypothetical protein
MAVASFGDWQPPRASERVTREIEDYLDTCEQWIRAPSTEVETASMEHEALLDDEDLRGTDAIAALLASFPPRQPSRVEIFPRRWATDDLVTLLLVTGETGVGVDPALLERLVDAAPDPQVRNAAVWARGGALEDLSSESLQIRAVAAEAMRRRAAGLDGSTKARLAFSLADADASVRAAAAATLAETRDPAALGPLVAALERWRQPEVAAALGALGERGAAEPLAAVLVTATASSSPDLLVAVLTSLSSVGDERQSEAIAPFVSDPRPEVRLASVRAAKAIGGARLEALVQERRADFSRDVRLATSLTD